MNKNKSEEDNNKKSISFFSVISFPLKSVSTSIKSTKNKIR